MKNLISALILVTSSMVAGQRPSFAGLSPIGYPPTPNRTTTTPDPLADRFGETEKLPIEANGDRDLIDRLSKLPIDKQPFWFINWQAYDKHRKEPQTFAQRPSAFAQPIPSSSNSRQGNNGFSTPNTGIINTEPTVFNRFAPTTTSSPSSNNANLRNGGLVYPNANVNPISHIVQTTNVYDNPNVYTSSNSNLNGYPNSNSNSNGYPNSNSNSNGYPNSNSNSNAFPDRYSNWNVYPLSNSNSNGNPAGNGKPNNYATGTVNTDNYSPGNTNSNAYQTAYFNSNSNTGTVNKNGALIETTQNYQWTLKTMTTKVVPTNLNDYTNTHPLIPGHDSYYNN